MTKPKKNVSSKQHPIFTTLLLFLGASAIITTNAFSLPPIFSTVASSAATGATAEFQPTVKKVAVAGATGRTGSLVVQELLDRNVNVVALVRDTNKAKETLPEPSPSLSVVKCDLGSEKDICAAIEGCDAAIWCATGFSDAPGSSPIDKLVNIFSTIFTPKKTIDAVGVPSLAKALGSSEEDANSPPLPKVVMLSSAGVTRPSWDEAKKAKYPGAADIPIVRLNPFNILNIKAGSEENLRNSDVNYCIVRPCGLNDKWPSGSRPVFSQGDIGVGRINRKDVAKVLVDVLSAPEAVGKTFEVLALAGYPAPVSINMPLARLRPDSEGPLSDEQIAASYAVLQQLLPGEIQDSAALAMGQTYEQLDEGETGRLGKRGEEDAESAISRS